MPPRPQTDILASVSEEDAITAMRIAAAKRKAQARGSRLLDYFDDPAGFAANCLAWGKGGGLRAYQVRALVALVLYRRVACAGPRGLGKTTLASVIILWFALTREAAGIDWKVVTTAGVWSQLIHYTWPEVHKTARMLRPDVIGRGPLSENTELLKLNLNLRYGEAFAVASTASDRIEGAHASEILYVFDESKIIPEATFDSAEGALSTGNAYAIAVSTPGEPQGRFYDIHANKPGFEDWHPVRVTKDEVIAAGLMDANWAERRRRQWGEDSQLYRNHVLGEFAASDVDGIIPATWVEAAFERYRLWEELGEALPPLEAIGVDVADGGADSSVMAYRYGHIVPPLRVFENAVNTMELAGYVKASLDRLGGSAIIDGIGVGSGVVNRLNEQACNISAFIASGRSVRVDKTGALRFANRRAEAWWLMREALDPDNGLDLAIAPDDELMGDLVAPRWKMQSNGRVLVESKDDLRKRLGRSTDRADAVVMANAGISADAADAIGLLECSKCGEYYNSDPTGAPRACPYCAGKQRRWRPPPGKRRVEELEEEYA